MRKITEYAKIGLLEQVKTLIYNGCDIDERDENGDTSVMNASYFRNVDILQFLIDCHADLNLQNKNGWTALMQACHCGYEEIVESLLNAGADPNLKNNRGESALEIAIEKNRMSLILLFEVCKDKMVPEQKELYFNAGMRSFF